MTRPSSFSDQAFRQSPTIAANAAVSGVIALAGIEPRGLAVVIPSVWTDADLGFEVSETTTSADFVPLFDNLGTRVKITGIATGARQLYAAPAECWPVGAWPYLRLVSLNKSTGANLNQAASRALVLVLAV